MLALFVCRCGGGRHFEALKDLWFLLWTYSAGAELVAGFEGLKLESLSCRDAAAAAPGLCFCFVLRDGSQHCVSVVFKSQNVNYTGRAAALNPAMDAILSK